MKSQSKNTMELPEKIHLQAIIPLSCGSSHGDSAAAMVLMGSACLPDRMVTHSWSNLWLGRIGEMGDGGWTLRIELWREHSVLNLTPEKKCSEVLPVSKCWTFLNVEPSTLKWNIIFNMYYWLLLVFINIQQHSSIIIITIIIITVDSWQHYCFTFVLPMHVCM